MLEKIEVGEVYLNSDKLKIEVLFVNSEAIFYKRLEIKESYGWSDVAYAIANWTKPEEKWFCVTYFIKESDRPWIGDNLFKSEQDFLDYEGTEKEDYHWIKLEEIYL